MDTEKIAVVFPGQGSQRVGMGKDFYIQSEIARDTYKEASEVLGWDVSSLCFDQNELLHLTEYSQPCILTTEIAMFRTIHTQFGILPEFFGGHSLGEYTALVAAGAISFDDALVIVQERGRLMQTASPVGTGCMTAVIGKHLPIDLVRGSLGDLPVDIANINSFQQVVISGSAESMDTAAGRIAEILSPEEELRFVPLPVSAPFHSRFMRSVSELFFDVLNRIVDRIHPEKAEKVTSNVSGGFHYGGRKEIVTSLLEQIRSTVNWHANMDLIARSANRIYEIGPSRVLRKFFQSIGTNCSSIITFAGAMREFDERGASVPFS